MKEYIDLLLIYFASESGQKIAIRVITSIFIGIGWRAIYRQRIYRKIVGSWKIASESQHKKVNELSRHTIVRSQFIISFMQAWVYRYDLEYNKIFWANGKAVKDIYIIHAFKFEMMLTESFLYAIGSIGIISAFIFLVRSFEKRYKFKVMP